MAAPPHEKVEDVVEYHSHDFEWADLAARVEAARGAMPEGAGAGTGAADAAAIGDAQRGSWDGFHARMQGVCVCVCVCVCVSV